ncbi:MAG: hypothetical protein JO331_14480 [Verrucomicrobia bacterium]|nr:hypothetical protein [Verrucomicrobiota bacterium]
MEPALNLGGGNRPHGSIAKGFREPSQTLLEIAPVSFGSIQPFLVAEKFIDQSGHGDRAFGFAQTLDVEIG